MIAEVGADLFGIYEDEVLSPEAKTSQSPVEKPKPASQRLVRTASMISPDEVPLQMRAEKHVLFLEYCILENLSKEVWKLNFRQYGLRVLADFEVSTNKLSKLDYAN